MAVFYFTEEMLKTRSGSIKGKTVFFSGCSGNVASMPLKSVFQLGAKGCYTQ